MDMPKQPIEIWTQSRRNTPSPEHFNEKPQKTN